MNNNNYLKRETHEYTIFIRNFNSSFGTWIKEEKKDFHWLFLNFFKRSKAGYCWNKHNLMLIPPPPPSSVISHEISQYEIQLHFYPYQSFLATTGSLAWLFVPIVQNLTTIQVEGGEAGNLWMCWYSLYVENYKEVVWLLNALHTSFKSDNNFALNKDIP